MVNGKNSCSTLWEYWEPKSGTKNHAWSGGPLIIMSKYFAGIKPLEKGYDTILVKPQFGNLNNISAKVATIKGNVELNASKADSTISINLTVPAKTLVAIPKASQNSQIMLNGTIIYENKKEIENEYAKYDSKDENYIYFYIDSGNYEFISK